MGKMLVRYDADGKPVIWINRILNNEPLSFYIDITGMARLNMIDGAQVDLGLMDTNSTNHLTNMDEITIKSELDGMLVAGYRVSVRHGSMVI